MMNNPAQYPIVQGWCPGALRPMMSGDGLVLRIRPMAARLTQAQAQGLAALAHRFGNGLIDFSSRGNVQLRGVSVDGHPDLIAALRVLDLVDETPQAEAQRNITASPFWTHQDETDVFMARLLQVLAHTSVPVLPSKFGFALDLGLTPVLQAISADIRLERCAKGGVLLVADGMAQGLPTTVDRLANDVRDLILWFVAQGGIAGGRGRMAQLISRGVLPPLGPFQKARQIYSPAKAVPGLVRSGAMVGFDFGQTDWRTLAALADLGPLRITPWRMVIVEGARQMPDVAGVITNPDDPMLQVTACTGKPGCLQALQPTRDLGRVLAPHLSEPIHISGCSKGCAHPKAAPLTLIGTTVGFDLVRQGTAKDAPNLRGLTEAMLCAHPEILTAKSPAVSSADHHERP